MSDSLSNALNETTERQAGHTPGPWRDRDPKGKYLCGRSRWTADYEGDCGIATSCPILAGKKTVALVVDTGTSDDVLKANARLIAAAPDLLAALKSMVSRAGYGDDDIVRAAIAKAEGRA